MFRAFIGTLLIAFVLGCAEIPPQPEPIPDPPARRTPPKFYYGDVVKVTGDTQIGIVISTTCFYPQRADGITSYEWEYTIMWREKQIQYKEDELAIVERFDWNKYKPSEPKAEIDSSFKGIEEAAK